MAEAKLIVLSGSGAATLDSRSDDELMVLAAAGRTDAFAALVARHLTALVSFCGKLVCDPRAGEELAQETWLKLWHHRVGYRPQGKFLPYLYTIARNRCRNQLRGRRRAAWIESDAAPPDSGSAPDHLDLLIAAERRRRLYRAMSHLGEDERTVLLLRFGQGLDYAGIARVIGGPEATARTRVHRALGKLRQRLERGEA